MSLDRLGKKDRAVIKAFAERRALSGHKLDTDGRKLDIVGLGGSDIAVWKDGKIHFPGTHGSRSGQYVEGQVRRAVAKNDLYNGRGYNPKGATKYRAIKWRRSSDETEPVGQWHSARSEALRDAYSDFAPHRRATYEIEDSHGNRKELTESQYNRAEQWYAGAMSERDAKGVWGNPKRVKNSHSPERSSREFSAWTREADNETVAAAEKGEKGDLVGMLDRVMNAEYALGRAAVERRYAGESVSADDDKTFRRLINGRSSWAESVVAYMRDVMGVAANPRRRKRKKNQHHKAAPTKFTAVPKKNASRKRRSR